MSAELTTLVLLTALFHAMWNALVKARDDRLVELATLNGTAGLIAFAALPFVGLPEPRAWPYLATTMVLHSGYYFFLLKSYAAGDLSHVYAVARGSGPVFVLATSSWVLHEPVSRAQVIGVLLIATSVASLAHSKRGDKWHLAPTLYALATGLTIGGYTLTDGAGARAYRQCPELHRDHIRAESVSTRPRPSVPPPREAHGAHGTPVGDGSPGRRVLYRGLRARHLGHDPRRHRQHRCTPRDECHLRRSHRNALLG